MQCKNCAGALTFAPGKNYQYCEFCGTFHFPENSNDRVVIVDNNRGGPKCPACVDPLVTAAVADSHVLHCRNCRGILLGNATFRQIIDALQDSADGSSGPPTPIDLSEYERILKCPECDLRMETHPYYGPGSVVIDTCGRCQLIWLDYGELDIVIDAHGRQR